MSSGRGHSSRRKSHDSPEILHHIGRAVLAYGIEKLGRQESSSKGSSSKKRDSSASSKKKSGRNKEKEAGTESSRRQDSSGLRSDNSDLHHHMSQLAAGVLAFGVRQYMHHRKEKKRKATAAASQGGRDSRNPDSRDQDRGLHFRPGRNRVDPELSTALESLTTELQGTSESIRRLTRNKPSHRNCEVHQGLVENSNRIQASLSNLQASVNNMRNLHPSLAKERRPERRERERARERPERRRESPRYVPRGEPRERPREMRKDPPRDEGRRRWEDGSRRGRRSPVERRLRDEREGRGWRVD